MANIWCCSATVTLDQPMDTPGYPKSTTISVDVKVRTETTSEPTDKQITEAAAYKMNACYPVKVLSITDPCTLFCLWENI